MGDKSPQAFRTIREVADWLEVEAHVLRFWESKFSQIKPVKRAGGRRYYRPADMKLIGGIKVLLHDQGLTIRGAQKRLQDDGAAQIAALSPPLEEELEAEAARTVDQSPESPAGASQEDETAPQSGFVDIDALAGGDAGDAARAEEDAPVEHHDAQRPAASDPASEPAPTENAAPESVAAATNDSPPPADGPVEHHETQRPAAPDPAPAADMPEDAAATAAAGEGQDRDAATPAPSAPEAPDTATTPLSEIRALLHRSVPLSDSQRARLGPLVARLDRLATRLRGGKQAE